MDFDTAKFITEIQNRHSLWNPKCSGYSDRIIKETEWKEVVNIYGANLSSEEKNKLGANLQKKWKNIRDCFVKAHKAKETKSGSAAKKKTPYIFYDNLLFLKDTISANTPVSNARINIEIKQDVNEDTQNNDARSSNSLCTPKRCKRNKNDDVGTVLIGVLNRNVEEKSYEDDEDRLFFLSLVKEFKRIPEHLRIQTKLDLLKVIKDAQFRDCPKT